MRTLSTITISGLFLLVSAIGCGGKSAKAGKDAMNSDATTATDGAAADAPGVDAASNGELGTSGYPGLDWGASMDAVKAKFPKAAPGPDTLSIPGNHAGLAGVTTFEFKDGKLFRISVSFDKEYPSMDDCLKDWADMRTTLEPTLGESSSDNGAAYWNAATYNITASCDPGDGDGGVMSMTYAQPDPS